MKPFPRLVAVLLLLVLSFMLPASAGAQVAAGTAQQLTQLDAMAAIIQALGGNTAAANQLVKAFGGDPNTALNAFSSGNAAASLAGAYGSASAISTLTQTLGPGPSIAALSDTLGPSGTLNALTGALGGSASIQTLATSIIGNQSAINLLQASLGGNTQGLRSLSAVLAGNTGALPGLVVALGGSQATLSALTGALGPQGAIGALATAIGADQALSVLTGALGPTGALNALTAAVSGQISQALAAIGVTLPACGVAPLTGTFAIGACTTTATNRNITYAKQDTGGKDVARKVEELHTDRVLPALKDSTAQLSAGTLDQSRQIASIMDGAQMADAKREIELQELESRKGLAPSDQACALPTAAPAIAHTKLAGRALSRALLNDFQKRANPTPGQPAARGYAAVIAHRYDQYCRLFVDPDDNNGISACAGLQDDSLSKTEPEDQTAKPEGDGKAPSDDPSTAKPKDQADADKDDGAVSLATLPNGDIDVEGLLLRDTIDIDEPGVRIAVENLLDNLSQHQPYPKLPPEALASAAGKQWTVQKERLEAVRNLSTSVIAQIVSRRIGIPLPQAVSEGGIMNTMEGGPSGQCNLPNEAGDANTRTKAFAEYYRSHPRTSDFWGTSTLCQRFSYSASGGTAFAGKPTIRQARAAAFGGAHTTASPAPAQGGGNADRALTAWSYFRRTGVAQPFDINTIKPGDLLYMVKVSRASKYEQDFRNGCNGNACEAGHTGVYMGGREICHVFHSPSSGQPIICTPLEYLTSQVGHPYQILGFVRPSGVNAQVADCTFDYNRGVQPGAPVTVTAGPLVGATSGSPPSTVPPPRDIPTVATPTTPPAGTIARGGYDAYLAKVGWLESKGNYRAINDKGYIGKYQFGGDALETAGCCTGARRNTYACGEWKSCFGTFPRSDRDFLNNPQLQEAAMLKYNDKQWDYLAEARNAVCTSRYGVFLTHSGLLGGAHLVGAGFVQEFVKKGYVKKDGYGTKVTRYLIELGGYTVPFGRGNYRSGNCPGDMNAAFGPDGAPTGGDADYNYSDYETPAPPRAVSDIIREIRQRAGVPNSEIGKDPSYNEIMLAMTKERFFDPSFFSKMVNNVPAMQRTEASLDAYTVMTLKDIEMLQEQINALSAARASLRIDELDRAGGQ